MTSEYCRVYKYVLTIFCLIPSLKSKHSFCGKISTTNYFHFFILSNTIGQHANLLHIGMGA